MTRKADITSRRAYLTELALRDFKARCVHCHIALTAASAPWVPFCSSDCRDDEYAVLAAMKETIR